MTLVIFGLSKIQVSFETFDIFLSKNFIKKRLRNGYFVIVEWNYCRKLLYVDIWNFSSKARARPSFSFNSLTVADNSFFSLLTCRDSSFDSLALFCQFCLLWRSSRSFPLNSRFSRCSSFSFGVENFLFGRFCAISSLF